ncbi:glycosyltransferase family 2 protein [Candidatus Moduliflexota bacterium]
MGDNRPLLSIIIPSFNEDKTIGTVLENVLNLYDSMEVLAVDDGSTDGTPGILKNFARKYPERVRVFRHTSNQGKGKAIRTALHHASGDITIIQDADLEYDPADISRVIAPIAEGKADVVYGSRIRGGNPRSYFSFYWGGRLLSLITSLLYHVHITDEATCYKAFKTDVLKKMNLECTGFEFCPEVTAKAIRAGYKIHEVPISYYPRSFNEGKKIGWQDGLTAIYTLFKYRFHKTG